MIEEAIPHKALRAWFSHFVELSRCVPSESINDETPGSINKKGNMAATTDRHPLSRAFVPSLALLVSVIQGRCLLNSLAEVRVSGFELRMRHDLEREYCVCERV